MYLLYKWLLTIFFGFYLFYSFERSGEYFFIFLTYWGVFLLAVYLLFSSIIITIHYIKPCFCEEYRKNEDPFAFYKRPEWPQGCCGLMHNTLKWYNYIQWLLFTISSGLAVGITILYWAFIHTSDTDHWDIALHLLNGVAAFLEVWVTRIPVRIYHALYIVSFSAFYVLFTAVYYGSDGANGYNNASYIYSPLDYENAPASAAVFAIFVVLIFCPIVHLFFYANYLLREGVLHVVAKKCKWIVSH